MGWFDASEVKQLGASLAQFFMQSTAGNPNRSGPFLAPEYDDTLGAMVEQLAQFKLSHKLNIYKKAQFGNAFKWSLKEKGYHPGHVDQLTNWLLLRL